MANTSTIKDVANRADVSVAKASPLLKGKAEGRVSEDVATKAFKAFEALGCRLSAAGALAVNKTYTRQCWRAHSLTLQSGV